MYELEGEGSTCSGPHLKMHQIFKSHCRKQVGLSVMAPVPVVFTGSTPKGGLSTRVSPRPSGKLLWRPLAEATKTRVSNRSSSLRPERNKAASFADQRALAALGNASYTVKACLERPIWCISCCIAKDCF